MKWTPTHVQILLWLAFQDVRTRNANSKKISESWPDINGENPSPRAVQEKLTSIKNGVEELGLVEFFGHGGVGVPRSKRAQSRSSANDAKGILRIMQANQQHEGKIIHALSAEPKVEDVSPQLQIYAQAQSNTDEKDELTIPDDEIDGETGTESEADSDVIIVTSRPVRDQTEHASSRASKYKSETDNGILPVVEKLRKSPKRTYEDGPYVELDSDIEPATITRQRKRPRVHHRSAGEEFGTAAYTWRT